jgi:hypothetical protein
MPALMVSFNSSPAVRTCESLGHCLTIAVCWNSREQQQQMITSVKTGKRSDEPWTPREDQRLLQLFDAEASWPLIAITLERGVEDVQDRARELRHEIDLGLKAK